MQFLYSGKADIDVVVIGAFKIGNGNYIDPPWAEPDIFAEQKLGR